MEEHQRVAVGCSHTDPVKGCGWTSNYFRPRIQKGALFY
jgi:hypothetical protein